MKKIIEGESRGDSAIKIAVVVAKFNSEFTEKLLVGAMSRLLEKKVLEENITVLKVPGAFEIPMVCKKLVKIEKYDAVIALGAVIRGDTYHFEVVCDQVAAGVQNVTIKSGVPVIFGVITTDTEEQAADRTGGKEGNKGSDAADAALEMISLIKKIDLND